MGLLGYGLMSFLAIVYEVFKVLFYVLGVLCFLKYLKSDRQPRPKMLRDSEPAEPPVGTLCRIVPLTWGVFRMG